MSDEYNDTATENFDALELAEWEDAYWEDWEDSEDWEEAELESKPPIEVDENFTNEKELDERDHQYTELATSYVKWYNKKSKDKITYAKHFFWFTWWSSVVIVFMAVSLIIYSMFVPDIAVTVLTAAITGLITATIGIPVVIVHYLFNPGEDEQIITLITGMQGQDIANRKLHQELKVSRSK